MLGATVQFEWQMRQARMEFGEGSLMKFEFASCKCVRGARLVREVVRPAHEPEQRDLLSVALVAAQRLPLHHRRPAALIHVIVDRDHRRHRLLVDAIALALAKQRIVKHLLRRVDPPPNPAGRALRDARRDTVGAQQLGLAGSRALVRRGHHVGRVDLLASHRRLGRPLRPLARVHGAALGLLCGTRRCLVWLVRAARRLRGRLATRSAG